LVDEYAEEASRVSQPKPVEIDEIISSADVEINDAIEMLEKLK